MSSEYLSLVRDHWQSITRSSALVLLIGHNGRPAETYEFDVLVLLQDACVVQVYMHDIEVSKLVVKA